MEVENNIVKENITEDSSQVINTVAMASALSSDYAKTAGIYLEVKNKVAALAQQHLNLKNEVEQKVQDIVNSKRDQLKQSQQKVRELLNTGNKYYREENYAFALEKWEQVLISEPNNREVKELIKKAEESNLLDKEKRLLNEESEKIRKQEIQEHINDGRKYYREEEYKKAIVEWEVALSLGVDSEIVQPDIDNAEKRLKEIGEEIDRAKKEREERAKQVNELDFAGKRFARLGEFERAIAEWEKALILEPEHKGLMEQIRRVEGQIKERKRTVFRVNEERERRIKEYKIEAMRYLRQGDYKKAIAEWESVLLLDSTQPSVLENIKQAELKLKEVEAEKRRIEQAPEEIKQKVLEAKKRKEAEENALINGYHAKARMLFTNGEYRSAIEEWEKVLTVDSKNNQALERIKRAENKIKENQLSVEQKAIEEKRRSQLIREKSILAEKHYRQKEFDQAILQWEELLIIGVPNGDTLREYILKAENKIKEAGEVFNLKQKEEKEKSEQVQAFLREGELLYWQEEYTEAIAKWEEALKIDSEHDALKDAIARAEEKIITIKQDKIKQAQEKSNKDRAVDARRKVALKLEAEGLLEHAIREWGKIIDMDVNNKEPLLHIESLNNKIEKIAQDKVIKEKQEREREQQLKELKEKAQEDRIRIINGHLNGARKYFLSEEFEKAIEEWVIVLNIDPLNLVAKDNIRHAEAEILKRKESQKREELREAEINQTSAELMLSAMNYKRNKEYHKAVYALEKILLLDNTRNDVVGVISEIEQEMLLDEENKLKKMQEQLANERLIKEQKEAEIKDLEAKINDNYLNGVRYFNDGHYVRALENWKKILLLDPQNSFIHAEIRKAEDKLREEERLRLKEAADKEDKVKIAKRFYEQGKQYFNASEYVKSIEALENALNYGFNTEEIKRKIDEVIAKKKEVEEREIRQQEERNLIEKEIVNCYVAAEKALSDGDLKLAIDQWEHVLKLDPRRKEIFNKIEQTRGIIISQENKVKKEKQEKENYINNLKIQAATLFRSQQYQDAVSLWEKLIIIDSASEQEYSGKIDSAERQIKLAQEEKKQALLFEEEKVIQLEEKKELLSERKRVQINEYYSAGAKYYSEQNYAKALEEWKKALLLDETNNLLKNEIKHTEVRLYEEETLRQKQLQNERELKLLKEKEALEKEILNKLTAAEKALIVGDFLEAINNWEAVLHLDPTRRDIFNKIEDLRKRIVLNEERKEKLQVEKEKQLSDLILSAADAYRDGKFLDAIKLWERILVLDSQRVDIRERIKEAELKIRDYEVSLEEQKFLLQQQEIAGVKEKLTKIENYIDAATKYEKDGDILLAISELEKVLILDRGNIFAAKNIERINIEIKRKEKAEAYEKEKEKETARKIQENIVLGKRYYREKEYSKAVACWEEALLLGGRIIELNELIDKALNRENEELRAKEKETREKIEQQKQLNDKLFNAETLYSKGEYEKALENWSKVLIIDEDSQEAKNGISKARIAIEEMNWKVKEKQEKVNELLLQSLEFENNKDYLKLTGVLNKILFLSPEREDIREKLEYVQQLIEEKIKEEKALERKKEQQREQEAKEALVQKEKQLAMFKEHYAQGMKYLQERAYRRAIEELGYILLFDGNNKFIKDEINKAESRLAEEEALKEDLKRKKEQAAKQVAESQVLMQRYYREAKYEKSIFEAERILVFEADNSEAAEMMHKAELRLKEIADEEERVVFELRKKELEVEKYYREGQKYYLDGDLEAAIDIWAKALILQPEAKGIKDAINRAQIVLKEARDKKSEIMHYQTIKDSKDKTRRLRLKQEEVEQEKIAALLLEANHLYQEEHYEKAIAVWEDVLLLDQDNKVAIENIHKAHREIKRVEEIKEAINLEEAEKEKQIKLYQINANKYFVEGNYEKAIEVWTSIISIDPYREEIIKNIAESQSLLLKEKREKERKQKEPELLRTKEEEIKRVQEQQKEQKIKDLYQEGLLWYRDENYEKAIEEWNRILFVDKNNQLAKIEIANAQEKMLKEEKKAKEIEAQQKQKEMQEVKAREMMDASEKIAEINKINLKAKRYFRQENFEKAIKLWEKILLFDPSNSEMLDNIKEATNKINELRERKRNLLEAEKNKKEQRLQLLRDKNEDKRLKKIEKKEASKRIKELYEKGCKLFDEKQYLSAKKIFDQIIELNETYRISFIIAIQVKRYLQQIEDAEDYALMMKAKIMATTSHMSIDDAMEILKGKKKE